MTINRNTVWVAGTALLCVALSGLAWLFVISPERTKAQDLRLKVESVNSDATTLGVRLAALKQQSLELSQRRAELAVIHQQLPPVIDVPTLITRINQVATSSGVKITSLTPGTIAAVTTGAAGTTATSSAQAAAAVSAATEAETSTGTAAATASGGSGLTQVPVTFSVSGEYFELSLFLKRVQSTLTTAFLVDSFSLTSDNLGAVSLTVQGRSFSMPATG